MAELPSDPIVLLVVPQGEKGEDGFNGLDGEEVSHLSSTVTSS